MKILILLAAMLAAGCTTVKPVTLSDGSQGHAISCGGTAQSMGDCMEKAGEICGAAGYTVMAQNGSSTPVMLSNGSFQASPQFSSGGMMATYGAIVQRSLFVKCGAS